MIQLLGLVGEAMAAQLDGVGAESVGLEHFRAGAHVLLMHFPHQLGLLHRQLVVAHVEEEALGVEHRPHGAIEDVHSAVRDQVPQ